MRRFLYQIFSSLRTNVHFETIDSSKLFHDVMRKQIILEDTTWKYGDMGNDAALIFLCKLVASGYTPVLEFGTFRGRTTYNLALNLPNNSDSITTVDCGFKNCGGYGEYVTGELFINSPNSMRSRIRQITADSMTLSPNNFQEKMGLVIVDGAHDYEGCKHDGQLALDCLRSNGIVVWDDYHFFWSGVKRALNELSSKIKLRYLPRERLVVFINEGEDR